MQIKNIHGPFPDELHHNIYTDYIYEKFYQYHDDLQNKEYPTSYDNIILYILKIIIVLFKTMI
jgi:hypothetical protein